MFRTDLLSIIWSLHTVFTAVGICHTSYVDCLLADCRHKRSEWLWDPRSRLFHLYRLSSPEIKRPESVDDHLPPSSAEVKNE